MNRADILIPEEALPVDTGRLHGRLFPHYRGGVVEYRYPRYLSWVGYAFILAGLGWAVALRFSFPLCYVPICTAVLGLLFIPTDRSTAKQEKRIVVDKVKATVAACSDKEVFWRVQVTNVLGVQIAYKHFPSHYVHKTTGSGRGRYVSAWGAYQVNLVWTNDEGAIQRGMVAGWRWRRWVQPVATSLARVLNVQLMDHATPEHVKRAKKQIPERAVNENPSLGQTVIYGEFKEPCEPEK